MAKSLVKSNLEADKAYLIDVLKIMLPFDHNHLAPQLAEEELLLLNIVLNLLQIHK